MEGLTGQATKANQTDVTPASSPVFISVSSKHTLPALPAKTTIVLTEKLPRTYGRAVL